MHTTANSGLLIRSEVWSNELKEILRDELDAMRHVDWMTDFPDGDTFTIPSIGSGDVDDYVEDTDVLFRPVQGDIGLGGENGEVLDVPEDELVDQEVRRLE